MPDIYVSKEKGKAKEDKENMESKNPDIELEFLAKEHTKNPFATFAVNPEGVRFETQEQAEKIILLLRMHWLTNIPWLFIAIVLILAPVVLGSFPLLDFLPMRYQFMMIIIWYLLVTAFIFEQFLTWVFNVYIVTDERIIDIDFSNLLYKEVSEAKIDKIQDVTYKVGGVVRSIFNYGDVFVQTAGSQPNFEFHAVPRPDTVTKVLQKLRTQEEIEVLEGRIK